MGFNLIRWFTDEQYKAVKEYRWRQDKRPLSEDYKDAVGGVVFDVGGFEGDFAIRCADELSAEVYCFEPIPLFQDRIRSKLAAKGKIQLRPFGLSDSTRCAKFLMNGLGTAEAATREDAIDVQLIDIFNALASDAPDGLDLLALNVEGAEYAILGRLFETGDITKIKHLRIQFHLTVENAREKYKTISDNLSLTHNLMYRYPFIWESWSRK